MKIEYKLLKLKDFNADLFKNFNRYQVTNQVWFKGNDEYQVKNDHFIEQWDENKKMEVIESLKTCLLFGGIVVGAFSESGLVGFANVEGKRFGIHEEYIELPFLHVSYEVRNFGIGKRLFKLCCEKAKQMGAQKLYIAAHPSIETQHFYQSVGCAYAVEVNENIFEKEPLDIQLEKTL